MAAWTLVPCLVSLRAEFNALASNRDKSSDGAIGDANHTSSSDHTPDEQSSVLRGKDADAVNEVHAVDVDSDLRLAGWSMDRVVQIIVTRHRLGLDDRLQNCIYMRKIYSRSWGWTARAYTGASPHDHHAHFSSRYDTKSESDTSPWGLLAANTDQEDDVLNADDKKWLSAEIRAQVTAALGPVTPQKMWEHKLPTGKTAHGTLVEANLRAGSAANDQLPKLSTALTQLAAGRVDQAALVAALTAALVPAFLAAVEPKLEDHDVVTADELKAAIVAATHDLLA